MEKEKFTFFWSEEPFSQWSNIGFTINKIRYNCAEQWMMACKARHFKDEETLKAIMKTDSPREQKKLGRKVKNFIISDWEKVARDYVYQGNIAKFTQNKKAQNQLFATAGTTLVEASPTDTLWGIGLDESDAKKVDRSGWRGKNWLGEVLTKVREDLMKGKP